jgi:hypothetical protein
VRPVCAALGCRAHADHVVRHPEYGRRVVCDVHAIGQEVLADV